MPGGFRHKSTLIALPALLLIATLGLLTSGAANRVLYSTIVWDYCYFGPSTGQIKHVYSLWGVRLYSYTEDTSLTKLIRNQIGDSPHGSEWFFCDEGGSNLMGSDIVTILAHSPLGAELHRASEDFCSILENNDPHCHLASRYGFRGMRGTPGDDVKRKALAGFIEALHASELAEDKKPAVDYLKALVAATSYLDRAPTAEDIPQFADVADSQTWQAKWEPRLRARRDAWMREHFQGPVP